MINISVKFVIWMLCYCMIFQQSASFLQSIVKCSNALGRTEPLRMVGGNKASNIGVSNIIKSLADSQVSLGAGAAGYMVLLVNRLLQSSETALTASNDIALRDDLLSIMACSALLLNALSEQEVQIKQRDRIPLLGYAYSSPVLASTLQSEDKRAAKWLLESTLQVNPCISSVAIIDANTEIVAGCGVLGRNGIIGSKVEESQLPILRKVLDSQGEEVYLPDLQVRLRTQLRL